jgi:hypothetical protein
MKYKCSVCECKWNGSINYCPMCGNLADGCQSCLVEHDRELKEAVEEFLCDYYLGYTGLNATKSTSWLQFWKERGIK